MGIAVNFKEPRKLFFSRKNYTRNFRKIRPPFRELLTCHINNSFNFSIFGARHATVGTPFVSADSNSPSS